MPVIPAPLRQRYSVGTCQLKESVMQLAALERIVALLETREQFASLSVDTATRRIRIRMRPRRADAALPAPDPLLAALYGARRQTPAR